MVQQTLAARSLILLSVLLLTFVTFAQPRKAAKEIKALMKKYQAVGVSVVVVKNNQVIYTKAFGLKNITTKEPLQTDDLFRIASISKSFTATALMQMVETGKLSLDDKVSDLVGFKIENPKYTDAPITLRMILSHTSSINDKNGYFTLDVIHPDKNPDWKNSYNDYAPGTGYEYCNLNFNMAGAILEKISGERFDSYIVHHILNPLQLYGGYNVDSLDKTKFATLYEYNDSTGGFIADPNQYASPQKRLQNYVFGYTTPAYSPTGGMKISAPGLARYMMMHMNYGMFNQVQILSQASSKAMQTPLSEKAHYGLALQKIYDLVPDKTLTGHTGDAYGLYSAMFFQPEEKFGFVVITNGAKVVYDEHINPFLKEVIRVLYKRLVR